MAVRFRHPGPKYNKNNMNNIVKDDYICLTTVWKHGFTHDLYCRGFELKSMLLTNESIPWINNTTYKKITQQEYEDYHSCSLEPVVTISKRMAAFISLPNRSTKTKRAPQNTVTTAKTAKNITKTKATRSKKTKC